MREITYRQALSEALIEEMDRDGSVFQIGEDIGIHGGAFGVTIGHLERYGEKRIINTPICEAAIAGAAVGAAIAGMRPVAEIMFIDFITISMDQIVNQAAKARYMFGGQTSVPMVLRTQGGGGVSAAAQHSQSLEAWLAHIPGLKVVMPSTPYDAKGLLKQSIRDDNPVIFIEHKMLYNTKGYVPEEEYVIPLGKGDIKRKGSDVTLIATSRMVNMSLEAAEILEKDGIRVEVVDPRTLVPLDEQLIIDSVMKTNRAVVVQEACQRGGYGSDIIRIIADKAFDYLDSPVKLVGAKEVPIPYGYMEKYILPQVEDIVKTVREIV
jgi:pyruvate/2-oxoglutarate/acetoin dehydrogenase E1 component